MSYNGLFGVAQRASMIENMRFPYPAMTFQGVELDKDGRLSTVAH